MQNWIFVIKDEPDKFTQRLRKKEWPIYHKTANRKKLAIGDKIVFYKAQPNGKKFVGTASISSLLQKVSEFEYLLKLSNVDIWKKPVYFENVKMKLDFIQDKKSWGRYFQGGVRKILTSDYEEITCNRN